MQALDSEFSGKTNSCKLFCISKSCLLSRALSFEILARYWTAAVYRPLANGEFSFNFEVENGRVGWPNFGDIKLSDSEILIQN